MCVLVAVNVCREGGPADPYAQGRQQLTPSRSPPMDPRQQQQQSSQQRQQLTITASAQQQQQPPPLQQQQSPQPAAKEAKPARKVSGVACSELASRHPPRPAFTAVPAAISTPQECALGMQQHLEGAT